MQGVRKRNIRNNKWTLLLFCCFAFPFLGYSQYSPENKLPDSIKTNILVQSNLVYTPITVKGIKIDRNNMPIFCKWELDIQDQTKIPVKFRLGSQEYVDRLEQKNKHF